MFPHYELIIMDHHEIMGAIFFMLLVQNKMQIGTLHVLAIAIKHGKVVLAQKILVLGGQVNK